MENNKVYRAMYVSISNVESFHPVLEAKFLRLKVKQNDDDALR